MSLSLSQQLLLLILPQYVLQIKSTLQRRQTSSSLNYIHSSSVSFNQYNLEMHQIFTVCASSLKESPESMFFHVDISSCKCRAPKIFTVCKVNIACRGNTFKTFWTKKIDPTFKEGPQCYESNKGREAVWD